MYTLDQIKRALEGFNLEGWWEIHHWLGKLIDSEAFSSDVDLDIRSETDEITYIPDLMVACNPEEWSKRSVPNPKLVVEVLSPSTRHIDTREKATNYRRVASIEEILLCEQSQPKITVFRRAEKWRPQIYLGTESVLELRSISLSIPLAQIYAGIPAEG